MAEGSGKGDKEGGGGVEDLAGGGVAVRKSGLVCLILGSC